MKNGTVILGLVGIVGLIIIDNIAVNIIRYKAIKAVANRSTIAIESEEESE